MVAVIMTMDMVFFLQPRVRSNGKDGVKIANRNIHKFQMIAGRNFLTFVMKELE